jgi:hypothetical protein
VKVEAREHAQIGLAVYARTKLTPVGRTPVRNVRERMKLCAGRTAHGEGLQVRHGGDLGEGVAGVEDTAVHLVAL